MFVSAIPFAKIKSGRSHIDLEVQIAADAGGAQNVPGRVGVVGGQRGVDLNDAVIEDQLPHIHLAGCQGRRGREENVVVPQTERGILGIKQRPRRQAVSVRTRLTVNSPLENLDSDVRRTDRAA